MRNSGGWEKNRSLGVSPSISLLSVASSQIVSSMVSATAWQPPS